MTFRRRNAGVISHDGLLYVVGGDDGSTNLSNVEVSGNVRYLTSVKNYEFEQLRKFTDFFLFSFHSNLATGVLSKVGYMAHFDIEHGNRSQLRWCVYH